MYVSDFDFDLPDELVAQHPAARRDEARLLVLDRARSDIVHASVGELPRLLRRGDVLVVNNTRVFPARLAGRRTPSGGFVQCLLISSLGEDRWDALMHPGQKLRVGARVLFEGHGLRLHGEIVGRHFHGRRTVRLWCDEGDVRAAIDAIGHVPLPPYIKRPDDRSDRERYQTVYARVTGSVAAPTAGLHLSAALLGELERAGVERAEVTLHVGYGTFKPVRVERVEDHAVDSEAFEIPDRAARTINAALDEGRRIVAVGTTTTRTLEASARAHGGRVAAEAGQTDLFIYPGFRFQVVGALLTNFHVPRSSLLMLACAFAGRERILAAYHDAIDRRYRFYSYGDAMLIL